MCYMLPYHANLVNIRPNKPQSRFDSYSIGVGYLCGSVPGHLHLGGDNPGESRGYHKVLVSLERAKRRILTLPSSHQQMIQWTLVSLERAPGEYPCLTQQPDDPQARCQPQHSLVDSTALVYSAALKDEEEGEATIFNLHFHNQY